jgi:hypothetical protein
MSDDELTMRRTDPDDTERLARFLGATFPQNPKSDPRVLRWQYWSDPYGDAVSWIWERSDEIVAHLARVPVPVLIAGRRCLGAMSADAATARAYRNRGLHAHLRVATNDDCCARGIPVAFHLQDAGSPLPRDDAPASDRLITLVTPLDADWLAHEIKMPRFVARSLVRAARPRGSGTATVVSGVSDEVDGLWSEIEPRVPFGIVKDGSWWKWRFEDAPAAAHRYFALHEDGRLTAAAATTVRPVGGADTVRLLEFLALGPDAGASLLRAIAHAHEGVAAIFMRASPRAHQVHTARSSGMRRVPGWLEPNRVRLHVRDTCGTRPDLVGAPWSFTLGDADAD